MRYPRSVDQRQGDFDGARRDEELVGSWLGQFKVGNLDSTEQLDWWLPGSFVEVKAKNQPLSGRWPLTCREQDAFILDELSVRKAMAHFPHAYFVLIDHPLLRVFLARVDEVVCADRCRINREGSRGAKKGKWVLNLAQFRQLHDPPGQLLPTIFSDQASEPWKGSALLIGTTTS